MMLEVIPHPNLDANRCKQLASCIEKCLTPLAPDIASVERLHSGRLPLPFAERMWRYVKSAGVARLRWSPEVMEWSKLLYKERTMSLGMLFNIPESRSPEDGLKNVRDSIPEALARVEPVLPTDPILTLRDRMLDQPEDLI